MAEAGEWSIVVDANIGTRGWYENSEDGLNQARLYCETLWRRWTQSPRKDEFEIKCFMQHNYTFEVGCTFIAMKISKMELD
jgi:hypothetical protein